ncbi:MAG: putative membrane protein insertion efficiency factor [Burkholderia sp.]|jgi:putative membrane protein insertion efficiency factor
MKAAEKLFKGLIRLYQLTLSPWVGRQCRFVPTCSNYALEAIERFGALRGSYLAVYRILRCQPFGGRGYDPVPKTFDWRVWRLVKETDAESGLNNHTHTHN